MSKICAVALIPVGKEFYLGIECIKGRGLILPGGKLEHDDFDYHACARRECYEETGYEPAILTYLWHGPDSFKNECFCFLGSRIHKFDVAKLKPTSSGKPCAVTRNDLLDSKYKAWYACLFDVIDRHRLLASAINPTN